QKIDVAQEIMRRQVASDISIAVDKGTVRLYEPSGDFYYVCGTATLNRPGSGPLALNNAQQRFITTVNRSRRRGGTLFDGSSSSDGQSKFQQEWARKCR